METINLYYTTYFSPATVPVLVAAQFVQKNLLLNQVNKKYDPVSLVTKEGILNQPISIIRYLASGTPLNGATIRLKSQINSWFQFFNIEIHVLLKQVFDQIFGDKEADQKRFTYSITELNKNLKIIDDHLKIKTFFVGNSITVVDIYLACQLQNVFKLLLSEAQRKKYVNLTRWFNFVRQTQPFLKYYGKKILCGKQSFKIIFKEEVKEKAKVQIAKKEETKEAVLKQNQGKFKMDDFKRQFQNTQNKLEVIQKLFGDFQAENWSIWKIHYQKDLDEGKVDFLTKNMASGSLQRLDGLRKTGFGTWGVYGVPQNYQIRGVMLWKGTQIAQPWKEHPSYAYHKFSKLNHQAQQDKKLILDYWLQKQTAEDLPRVDSKRFV